MTDEINFIKKELTRKGYPLENYVQALLVDKGWRVHPNAYFLDKDTGKGREIDIKAIYDDFDSSTWSHFIVNLLVQCRRLPGNVWIFFSVPRRSALYMPISRWGLAEFLRFPTLGIYDRKETHFDKSEVVATNYCEIITDKKKSNKRVDNIWECAVTLIKATSQELEEGYADCKKYLEEDKRSFEAFTKKPFELVSIFYSLIVFEGKMYEARFSEHNTMLKKREYVQIFVDYLSGRYKGRFCIDVVTKERFPHYLKAIGRDLTLFDKRRVKKSEEYERNATDAVMEYFAKAVLSK